MTGACLIRTDRDGLGFWLKDYRVHIGDRIEWIWTTTRSLAARLPRSVAGAVQRDIVALESIAVAVIPAASDEG